MLKHGIFGPSDEGSICVEEFVKHVKKHWSAIDYEIQCDPKQLHEANLLKLDCSKAHINFIGKMFGTAKQHLRENCEVVQSIL